MKKLFTLLALLTCFMGANAKLVVDKEVDFSKFSDISEVPRYSWGGAQQAWDRLSIKDGCLHFHSTEAVDPGWACQFFPIGGVTAEPGVTYTLHFKIKGTVKQNVSMLGFGQTPYGQFPITTEWVESSVDYVATNTDGNILMQCGDYVGDWDIAYLKITHEEKSIKWVEQLTNGDAETPWTLAQKATSAYDQSSNYKICAWGKVNAGDPTPAEIVEYESGKHAFIVRATDCVSEGDPSAWDNQFWIESPKQWSKGDKVKVHFRYKASQNAKTNTQVHGQNPGSYIIWHAIGDVNFTTQWQTFDGIMAIADDMDKTWSIAFNLNPEVKTATDFYFDDLSWSMAVEGEEEEPEEVSYTIKMKDNGTDSDSGSSITEMDDIIEEGAGYLTAIEAEKVYNARTGRGVKLGSSKAIGSLKMTLAQPVTPTKIVVTARKYNDKGENYISINGNEFTLSDATSEDCTIEYDGNTTVSEILINTTETDKKYRTYVLGVTVYYMSSEKISDDGSFKYYTSFDFNSCAKGAVSQGGRHAGDITEVKTIIDKEGKKPSNAILTITPNLDVDDYPAEVPAVTRFVNTEAGPQLRVSGGYNGMTLKIEATADPLYEIKFNLTNWSRHMTADKGLFDPQTGVWLSEAGVTYPDVTFTIQADTTEVWEKGKLQEVILNDMGLVYINSIDVNPVYDIVIAPTSGTELSAAAKEGLASVKSPKSLTINLDATGEYTIANSIETNVPLTINGNGAGIDATSLNAPFIALAVGASATVPQKNQEVYADAQATDYNLLEKVEIDDVMIKNLKGSIISTNGQDWALVNLNITNSIIQLDNDGTTFIRFDKTASNKGAIKNINIQNNTIYNISSKSAYFIRYANASNAAKAFGINNNTSTYDYNISNNTLINTFKDQNFGNNTVNNSKTAITMKNNIFVDVKNITKFAQGNCAKTMEGNFTWGSVTAEEAVAKAVAAGFTTPTAALDLTKANGGLNLTPTGEAKDAGDPRWIGGKGAAGDATGIEAVKNAQDEGAWYTIQGVRVAQPTKGLYIHNGKKVVIK